MYNNQIVMRKARLRSCIVRGDYRRAWRILWRRIKYRTLVTVNMVAFVSVCYAVVLGFMCMLICWS